MTRAKSRYAPLLRGGRVAALIALLIAGVMYSLPVRASYDEQTTSIHFNSGQPDFGTLPRRARMYYETDIRPDTSSLGGEADCGYGVSGEQQDACIAKEELSPIRGDAAEQRRQQRDTYVRGEAQSALARGDWAAARNRYAALVNTDGWTGDLRDRVAILDEAQIRNITSATIDTSMRRYFTALDQAQKNHTSTWGIAKSSFDALAAGEGTQWLRPYARYQSASLQAAQSDFSDAIAGYQALLRDFPHFSRREDTLIMLARCAILPCTADERDLPAGADALRTLHAQFPHTRFRRAAIGLRARGDYLQGNIGAAILEYFAVDDLPSVELLLRAIPAKRREPCYPRLLCTYLRHLDRAHDYETYARAVHDVQATIDLLTPDGANTFVAQMRREPDIAVPYFYYRLYHCDNKSRDLAHLARLADSFADARVLQRSPRLAVRLAEVFYQNRRYADALRWAASAQRSPVVADRALYVQGASLEKIKRDDDARAAFASLLAHFPASPLRVAARENLALLDEARNDLGGALDQYFFLHYQPDIAFFLDARMTTAQVTSYVAAHPRHPQRDLLIYSLGIRYLRDENWTAARHSLASLPRKTYRRFGTLDSEYGYFDSSPNPNPLGTTRALGHLYRAAQAARTPNARAHAWYRCAAYYYDNGTLLLYNNALWQGRREFNFDFYWNKSAATPAVTSATHRYMYTHETYARAEAVCKRIAHDYPDSPTAPYALYRAACCENKLANFNEWWRNDGAHYHAAARLMAGLARRYPRHALAHEARKFARVFASDAEAATNARSRKTDLAAL